MYTLKTQLKNKSIDAAMAGLMYLSIIHNWEYSEQASNLFFSLLWFFAALAVLGAVPVLTNSDAVKDIIKKRTRTKGQADKFYSAVYDFTLGSCLCITGNIFTGVCWWLVSMFSYLAIEKADAMVLVARGEHDTNS